MTDKHDKLWEIMDSMMVCMVTTNDDGALRSRPMAPYIDTEKKTIRFLTDRTSAKVEELHHDRDLNLSFANNDDLQFVSVSGRGSVSTNREIIKELWGPQSDIWFGGNPETADVAVVSVVPEQAEYWDNDTGTLKMAYEMAKGYFSEESPDLGENAKLNMAS